MTETCAGISITAVNDVNLGHVGPPISSTEVVLRDVPDMNYFANGPVQQGEILVRGANIFEGYFKFEEGNKEAFVADPNGGERWLATGDVGRWNANGTLSIIDRKKNMCKLSQGEYVSLEKVEDVYGKAGLVGQIFIYGNSYKSFLVAVVSPNPSTLQSLCLQNGWWPDSSAQVEKVGTSEKYRSDVKKLLQGPNANAVKQAIFAQMKEQEGPAKLNPFEKLKDIFLDVDFDENGLCFNEANNCLTPSMKKKRKQLNERYMSNLKAMYTTHGEAPLPDEKW
jgi:long-chain acyl-CoA synthetase